MNILLTLVVVTLLFSATIFVHELGHFLVARALGLVAETFSIGFDPAIWRRRIRGIWYQIGAIPVGGYVVLPQLEVAESKESEASWPPVAWWKKILVAVAGAAGNLLFAWVLSVIVFWVGKPSAPYERSTTVGYVAPGSEAAAASVQPGDRILRAAGRSVADWIELTTRLTLEQPARVELELERPDGTRYAAVLPVVGDPQGIRMPAGVGMVNIARVLRALPGMSAEAAGVQPGDVILALDGRAIYSREHLRELVQQYADRETVLSVRRDGQRVDLTVRPTLDPKEGRVLIGIQFDTIGNVDYDQFVHPSPMSQLRSHAGGIFRFLRSLVTPRQARAAAEAVGGPVSILYLYWQVVRLSLRMALWFTAFLNVNLAILNLLPIPVLDGGHVGFALLEGLRGRPLPRRWVFGLRRVFAGLLVALLVVLTYRDSLRWLWPLRWRPRAPEASRETATPGQATPEPARPSVPATP